MTQPTEEQKKTPSERRRERAALVERALSRKYEDKTSYKCHLCTRRIRGMNMSAPYPKNTGTFPEYDIALSGCLQRWAPLGARYT